MDKEIIEIDKPSDLGEMIYIFVGEDSRFILPFKGSEAEMNQMWDMLAERGVRIKAIHHMLIQTADRNPYSPLL
jgi:hypothetical protein